MALIDNLVSYWKMDEASGNALDAHGSNTLTEASGTIASATGKLGGGRDFEAGDTEWLQCADNASLRTGNIDFTLQAWVNPESLTAGGYVILGKWNGIGSNREYLMTVLSSVFSFNVSVNGASAVTVLATNFGSPSVGQWHLVHAWHDSVNDLLGIAINGGTPNTIAHADGVRSDISTFALGAYSVDTGGLSFFDGILDEVALWKRVLTSTERTQLYNGGNGLPYPFNSRRRRVLLGAAA